MTCNSNTIRSLTRFLCCLVVSLPIMCGCGGGNKTKKITGKIEGTVTFNGQPVKVGSVSFAAKAGGDGAAAPLDASGKFKVAEPLPIGTYVAVVLPGTITPDEMADGKKPPPSDDIPERYRSAQTSELTFEVKEGQNPPFEIKMVP